MKKNRMEKKNRESLEAVTHIPFMEKKQSNGGIRLLDREQHFIENAENTIRQKKLKNKNRKTLKIAIPVIVIALLLVLFFVVKQNTNLFSSNQTAEMQSVEKENSESNNNQQSNNQNGIQKSPANSGISTYATTASGDYKIYGE